MMARGIIAVGHAAGLERMANVPSTGVLPRRFSTKRQMDDGPCKLGVESSCGRCQAAGLGLGPWLVLFSWGDAKLSAEQQAGLRFPRRWLEMG